jgi:hypothetical protein
MVYLVVLVKNPTDRQKFDDGAVPTIVAGPQAVVADTDTQAAAKAMRFLPEELKGKEERIEVSVLPFVKARV